MENSMNSMNNLMITSSSQEKREDHNSSPEESGWTFYIQSSLSSSSCYEVGGSLLSDAASSAVKIYNYQNDGGSNVNYERSERNSNKNHFRKRKVLIQGAAMDDDLEDTASSPVNSPKVSNMKDFEMKQKEMSNAYLEVESKSTTSKNDVGGDRSDITDLKKRGLCLVPLSNVANYFSY